MTTNLKVDAITDAETLAMGQLAEGDLVVSVTDYGLAAALVTVGIKMMNPPYYHTKDKHGNEKWTFLFMGQSRDGDYSTTECVAWWKRDLDFIKENPDHPFAKVMAAVKNCRSFLEHMNSHTPYVMFSRTGGTEGEPVMLMVEGSKKHKAAITRGFTQV